MSTRQTRKPGLEPSFAISNLRLRASFGFRNSDFGFQRHRGFTLVELLVVIGIIVILVGVLIPVAGSVRTRAQTAATRAFMSTLSGAIDNYHNDFNAYPGPLSNLEVWNDGPTNPFPSLAAFNGGFTYSASAPTNGFETDQQPAQTAAKKITMSENLVLGLLGGLTVISTDPDHLVYDPQLVGNGPNSLNLNSQNKTAPVKHYNKYLEANNLSWRPGTTGKKTGHFKDDAGDADDSIIPEFVDQYPSALPILYLRAQRGANGDPTAAPTETTNAIITYDSTNTAHRVGQYDVHQILGYTNTTIGEGRKAPRYEPSGWNPPHGIGTMDSQSINTVPYRPDPNNVAEKDLIYRFPLDAYAYFRDYKLSGVQDTTGKPRLDVPHQKDGYILISAGPDRVYGTLDDVTNFGDVGR